MRADSLRNSNHVVVTLDKRTLSAHVNPSRSRKATKALPKWVRSLVVWMQRTGSRATVAECSTRWSRTDVLIIASRSDPPVFFLDTFTFTGKIFDLWKQEENACAPSFLDQVLFG